MTESRLRSGIAERLEDVRKVKGFNSLRAFHEALIAGGMGDFSYTAARNYHDPGPDGRSPPVDYLNAVAQTFEVNLQWLVTGGGPVEGQSMTDADVAVGRQYRNLPFMPNLPLTVTAALSDHIREQDAAAWREEIPGGTGPDQIWEWVLEPLGGRAPLDWQAFKDYAMAAIHARNLALRIRTTDTEEKTDG